jgi:transposase
MRRAKLDGRRIGRVPLDVDHAALVKDRLSGMSLTKVAKRYSLSRASVVRFVRLAKEAETAGGVQAISQAMNANEAQSCVQI